jgi:hypothetical protein
MRRLFCLVLAFAVFVGAAVAAGEGGGKRKQTTAPPNEVEMPFLMAPVIRGGELFGYIYVASKMITPSAEAALKVRNKLAYIQDAYVRDVSKTPISASADIADLDRDALNRRLTAIAGRIAGEKNIGKLVFVAIKFAPLREGAPQTTVTEPEKGGDGAEKSQQNGQNAANPGTPP